MNPFVKWVGGKRQLIPKILELIPKKYNRYYEPFVGGGALFLELKPDRATIGDINPMLINVYIQIKFNLSSLLKKLSELDSVPCNKDLYLSNRNLFNQKISSKEKDSLSAALFIWINKHCFNGLYRVNKKGLFNVPYNNKTEGNSFEQQNLKEISRFLWGKKIIIGDFSKTCSEVLKNDFVFLDSPYVPISETADFVDYTKEGFSKEDHIRLSEEFKRMDKLGAKLLTTNHNTEFIRGLYQNYEQEIVSVKRMINSKADKRTGTEIIIKNY